MRNLSSVWRSLALAMIVVASTTAQAAFRPLPSPTPETPGVALDLNTLGLTGTVLATLDSPFVDNAVPTPFAQGTLRSLVVDRGGGLLDVYYQLVNTSPPPPDLVSEFYRLKTIGGFDPSLLLSVAQTNSLSGLVAGAGSGFVAGNYVTGGALQPASTADRDVGTIGSVGFDFPFQRPAFIGDANNVQAGESSSFLVVRTNASQFGSVRVSISGAATSFANSFAVTTAIPEPGTCVLLASSLLPLASLVARRRKS